MALAIDIMDGSGLTSRLSDKVHYEYLPKEADVML